MQMLLAPSRHMQQCDLIAVRAIEPPHGAADIHNKSEGAGPAAEPVNRWRLALLPLNIIRSPVAASTIL